MKTWQPGTPVRTAQDRVEWDAWRKDRKRQQQAARRAQLRRFDYYADSDTAAALEGLWKPIPGNDFSSIINGIVRDWIEQCHRNK